MIKAVYMKQAEASASSEFEACRPIGVNGSAVEPGPPTKRRRAADGHASAAHLGSAEASSCSASSLVLALAHEPVQSRLANYRGNPHGLSSLERDMLEIREGLARRKRLVPKETQ